MWSQEAWWNGKDFENNPSRMGHLPLPEEIGYVGTPHVFINSCCTLLNQLLRDKAQLIKESAARIYKAVGSPHISYLLKLRKQLHWSLSLRRAQNAVVLCILGVLIGENAIRPCVFYLGSGLYVQCHPWLDCGPETFCKLQLHPAIKT